MTVGRIHSPELAEEILQRGDADLIVMARPLLADPELPEKLRTQRRTQIRPCISCENCIDSMESANMSCAVNGLSGREGELSLAPARGTEARASSSARVRAGSRRRGSPRCAATA